MYCTELGTQLWETDVYTLQISEQEIHQEKHQIYAPKIDTAI